MTTFTLLSTDARWGGSEDLPVYLACEVYYDVISFHGDPDDVVIDEAFIKVKSTGKRIKLEDLSIDDRCAFEAESEAYLDRNAREEIKSYKEER